MAAMPLDELVAYATAAAGITTVLVNMLDNGIVTPAGIGGGQRDALLRAANYALNFGLLLLVLGTHNAYVLQDTFLYILLAFGQAIGSHVGHAVVSDPPPDGSTNGSASTDGSTDGTPPATAAFASRRRQPPPAAMPPARPPAMPPLQSGVQRPGSAFPTVARPYGDI